MVRSRVGLILGLVVLILVVAGVYVKFSHRAMPETKSLAPNPHAPSAPPSGPTTGAAKPAVLSTAKPDAVPSGPQRNYKIYGTVTDSQTGAAIAGAKLEAMVEFNLPNEDDPAIAHLWELSHGRDPDEVAKLPEEQRAKIQAVIEGKETFEAVMGTQTENLNAVSDTSGAYVMTMKVVGKTVNYGVDCAAQGYATEEKKSERDVDTARLDFQLLKGTQISGRVIDTETGQGIPNATVTTEDARRGTGALADNMQLKKLNRFQFDAKTDPSGNYSIEGLEAGNYRVFVSNTDEGYLDAERLPVIVNAVAGVGSKDVNLRMTKGGIVEGTVKDSEGKPIPNATVFSTDVHINDLNSDEPFTEKVYTPIKPTDEAGNFTVKGLKFDSEYILRAEHDNYAYATKPLRVSKGNTLPHVDFVLTKGVTVAGVARDSKRTPVDEVRMVLTRDGVPDDAPGESTPMTDTNKQGQFSFQHVSPGDYTLTSFNGGEVKVAVKGMNDITGVDFEIPERENKNETASIQGTVVDAQGKPVPEATIDAEGFEGRGYGISDSHGRFSIGDIADGVYTLEASTELEMTSAKNIKTGADVTLTMHAKPSVSGIVIDATGEPVADCSVQLALARIDARVPTNIDDAFRQVYELAGEKASHTDSSGVFTLYTDEPGQYVVRARSSVKGAGKSDAINLLESDAPKRVTVKLEACVSFAGTVCDSKSVPLAGATVALSLCDGPDYLDPLELATSTDVFFDATGSAVADAQGAFTIPDLSPGRYVVTAAHPGYAVKHQFGVNVPKNGGVSGFVIHLAPGGAIKGTYTLNGAPVKNGHVTIVGPSGLNRITCDSQGQFEAENLSPGDYTVKGEPIESFDANTEDTVALVKVEVAEGESKSVSLGENAGVTVMGRVNSKSADEDLVVFLVPAAPKEREFDVRHVPMDLALAQTSEFDPNMEIFIRPGGTYKFIGVAPGEYDIEVRTAHDPFGVEGQSEKALKNGTCTIAEPLAHKHITVGDKPIEVNLDVENK